MDPLSDARSDWGRGRHRGEGETAGALIEALERRCPGVKGRLCREGRLDPTIAIHVDGRIATRGLREPMEEGSEVQFVSAVGGWLRCPAPGLLHGQTPANLL